MGRETEYVTPLTSYAQGGGKANIDKFHFFSGNEKCKSYRAIIRVMNKNLRGINLAENIMRIGKWSPQIMTKVFFQHIMKRVRGVPRKNEGVVGLLTAEG
jgi:hypothetical protein